MVEGEEGLGDDLSMRAGKPGNDDDEDDDDEEDDDEDEERRGSGRGSGGSDIPSNCPTRAARCCSSKHCTWYKNRMQMTLSDLDLRDTEPFPPAPASPRGAYAGRMADASDTVRPRFLGSFSFGAFGSFGAFALPLRPAPLFPARRDTFSKRSSSLPSSSLQLSLKLSSDSTGAVTRRAFAATAGLMGRLAAGSGARRARGDLASGELAKIWSKNPSPASEPSSGKSPSASASPAHIPSRPWAVPGGAAGLFSSAMPRRAAMAVAAGSNVGGGRGGSGGIGCCGGCGCADDDDDDDEDDDDDDDAASWCCALDLLLPPFAKGGFPGAGNGFATCDRSAADADVSAAARKAAPRAEQMRKRGPVLGPVLDALMDADMRALL